MGVLYYVKSNTKVPVKGRVGTVENKMVAVILMGHSSVQKH
jgi:hypothetical protein